VPANIYKLLDESIDANAKVNLMDAGGDLDSIQISLNSPPAGRYVASSKRGPNGGGPGNIMPIRHMDDGKYRGQGPGLNFAGINELPGHDRSPTNDQIQLAKENGNENGMGDRSVIPKFKPFPVKKNPLMRKES
jgi:hypothetical protein